MVKLLLLVGVVAAVAYYLKHRVTVSGTVTAVYSDAKISTPAPASPGDSPENALIGPATYTY